MSKISSAYNLAKIYSDFEAFKPNNTGDVKSKPNNTILLVSKITDSKSNFDKICKLCIGSK